MSSSIPMIEEIILDKGDTGLGFNIRGGTDNIHIGNDPGIFVTTIKMNGAAAKDGRLQPGDKILEINGNDLREVQHQRAVTHFHNAGSNVNLLVERGAEQRIIVSEHSDSRNDQIVHQKDLYVSDRSFPNGSFYGYGWRWLPITILLGGSAFLLLWYLRRRRQ